MNKSHLQANIALRTADPQDRGGKNIVRWSQQLAAVGGGMSVLTNQAFRIRYFTQLNWWNYKLHWPPRQSIRKDKRSVHWSRFSFSALYHRTALRETQRVPGTPSLALRLPEPLNILTLHQTRCGLQWCN